jgi:hypothetical protein
MIRQIWIAAAVACSTLLAPSAFAGTLVDTGAPTFGGYVFDAGIYGGDFPFETRAAARFSLEQQSTITGIEAYLDVYNTGTFGFQIVSAAEGAPDTGSVLFDAAPVLEGNPIGGWAGPNGLNLSLSAGDYWLVLRGIPDSPTFVQLQLGTPDPLANYAYWNSDDETWFVTRANPQRPNDFGIRIFGTAGAVPEPASWSLLITGFGLTGAALRRRRLQTA